MPRSLLGRIIAGLAAGLAALAGSASSATADEPDMSLSWLTGRVYLVEDAHFAATNSLVFVGNSSVTVVGATWTPETAKELAARIRSVTDLPIREVIDTSPDPEWSGGNAYWEAAGAQVIAAQVTCDTLSRTWDATVASTQKAFPGYPSLPLAKPTKCAANDFELQNGAVRVFYLGPSHTPADVFVYFPRERVLDAGSILKPFLGNMAKANAEQYPATLHKLQSLHLDIRMVIAGHWSAVHGPDLVDLYLKLLAENASPAK
jgi:metallo-beta-lactamase class B